MIAKYQKSEIQVAEVGCYDAETTLTYIDIIKRNNKHLYLIDWFSGAPEIPQSYYHGWRPHESNDLYEYVLSVTEEYKEFVTILRGKSSDVSKFIKDKSLDFCFIDADHLYKGIKEDIQLYLPKMKKGAILMGHDCEDITLANTFTDEELNSHYVRDMHPGVIQAVYEHFGNEIEII